MFSAAFIFKTGTYDDEFNRLNKLIDAASNTERPEQNLVVC